MTEPGPPAPRASEDLLRLDARALLKRLAQMTPRYGEKARHWEIIVAWLERNPDAKPQHNHDAIGLYAGCPACDTVIGRG